MKALIVDDEKPNREGLKLMLTELCPEITDISTAASAEEARKLFQSSPADIIFVDINMPNENGFEFLDSISEKRFAAVFVTAYSEYALRAIKANAVDYILKPIDAHELRAAVARSIERLSMLAGNDVPIYSESIANLRSSFSNGRYPAKLTLPHVQGFNIVSADDIICIEAEGNYSVLHLQGGKHLVVTRALGEFEFMLNPEYFFRSHKSAIINLRYLKEYSSLDGHFALMQNGMKLHVSRRRLDEFMTVIDKFSKRM